MLPLKKAKINVECSSPDNRPFIIPPQCKRNAGRVLRCQSRMKQLGASFNKITVENIARKCLINQTYRSFTFHCKQTKSICSDTAWSKQHVGICVGFSWIFQDLRGALCVPHFHLSYQPYCTVMVLPLLLSVTVDHQHTTMSCNETWRYYSVSIKKDCFCERWYIVGTLYLSSYSVSDTQQCSLLYYFPILTAQLYGDHVCQHTALVQTEYCMIFFPR